MPRSKGIDSEQAECINRIEKALRDAEMQISMRAPTTELSHLNGIAADIHQLERIYKRRRSNPKKELALKIRLYRSWRMAIVGATLVNVATQPFDLGSTMLQKAHQNAEEVLQVSPNSPEFGELRDKIKKWQDQ